MIKQNLVLFLILFVTTILHSQVNLQGIVLDSISEVPIGYVNIGVLENTNGTVSLENGQFNLSLKENESDLNIRFSSIGYESKTYSAKELANKEKVFLKPISYSIQSLKIKAKQFKKKKRIGKKVRSDMNTIAWGSSDFLGLEVGVPIKIKKESFIKSAHFGVLKASSRNTLLRVNIYEFKNGKVGKNIMPQNVFVTSGDLIKYKKVDLSHLNLVVEDDVLLSLETIEKDASEGFYLKFGTGLTFSGNIYYRDASQAVFQKSKYDSMMKLGAYLKVMQVK